MVIITRILLRSIYILVYLLRIVYGQYYAKFNTLNTWPFLASSVELNFNLKLSPFLCRLKTITVEWILHLPTASFFVCDCTSPNSYLFLVTKEAGLSFIVWKIKLLLFTIFCLSFPRLLAGFNHTYNLKSSKCSMTCIDVYLFGGFIVL